MPTNFLFHATGHETVDAEGDRVHVYGVVDNEDSREAMPEIMIAASFIRAHQSKMSANRTAIRAGSAVRT